MNYLKKINLLILALGALFAVQAGATSISAYAMSSAIPQFDNQGNVSTIRVIAFAATHVDDVSFLHGGFPLEIFSQFIENHQSNCDQFRRLIGTICDTTFSVSEGATASCPTTSYWSGECDRGYRVTNQSFYGNDFLVFADDQAQDCGTVDCSCL
ncbi:MAG: hypothetical protein AAGM22_31730 [Acidobacteriota bacterium]